MTNAGTIRDTKSLQYLTWSYLPGEQRSTYQILYNTKIDIHLVDTIQINTSSKDTRYPQRDKTSSSRILLFSRMKSVVCPQYTCKPLKLKRVHSSYWHKRNLQNLFCRKYIRYANQYLMKRGATGREHCGINIYF